MLNTFNDRGTVKVLVQISIVVVKIYQSVREGHSYQRTVFPHPASNEQVVNHFSVSDGWGFSSLTNAVKPDEPGRLDPLSECFRFDEPLSSLGFLCFNGSIVISRRIDFTEPIQQFLSLAVWYLSVHSVMTSSQRCQE